MEDRICICNLMLLFLSWKFIWCVGVDFRSGGCELSSLMCWNDFWYWVIVRI